MGKIVVTGVHGFLGSHISKYLYDLGYDIVLMTRGEFLNQDWKVLEQNVDYVVHCAWPTDKDIHSVEHLEFAEWTCNFFKECSKRGIKVINLGSSSEYGVKDKPMKEDMLCEPINAYGIAKLSVTLYAKLLGYNTLRIFSPYGEGGKNFMSLKDKVKKYGNPKDNRDYYPVELVCHAVERLIHSKHLYGEIINVCSGDSRTNLELTYGDWGEPAEEIDSRWYKYPQRQYEPSLWVGNNDKMKKLLNL